MRILTRESWTLGLFSREWGGALRVIYLLCGCVGRHVVIDTLLMGGAGIDGEFARHDECVGGSMIG